MAVSVSGVITLLILILGGPFLYGIAYVYRRLSNNKVEDSNKSDKSDKDTNVGSSSNNSSSSSSGELSIKSGNGIDSAKPTNEDHQEKQETRETYKSSEYIFALVGYAIGIGTFAYFSNSKR